MVLHSATTLHYTFININVTIILLIESIIGLVPTLPIDLIITNIEYTGMSIVETIYLFYKYYITLHYFAATI